MTTEAGGPVESVTVTEHQTGHDPRSCEACIRAREEAEMRADMEPDRP